MKPKSNQPHRTGQQTWNRYLGIVFGLSGLLAATVMIWQAIRSAPTSDELAHLASGVAIVKTSDFGYYRVNPPLHKLLSGVPVELLYSPKISGLYPASLIGSGFRQEFQLGEQFASQNCQQLRGMFILGRLVRIPLVLGVGLCFVLGFHDLPLSARLIAGFFWYADSLLLGQGWLIMPDALSAVASFGLLAGTMLWLKAPSWNHHLIMGICWGLALGTKFTFGPLFVVWPCALWTHAYWVSTSETRSLSRAEGVRLLLLHLGHGALAAIVLAGIYAGSEIGVQLSDHGLRSKTLEGLGQMQVPSPLPKQFFVGLDEQMLDIEQGLPTYVLGTWYPNGIWWYYLVGFFAKAHLVTWGAVLASLFYLISMRRFAQANRAESAMALLCTVIILVVFVTLSANSKMALNVRYLLPAAPFLCMAAGIAVNQIGRGMGSPSFRLVATLGLIGGLLLEVSFNYPHYFAYANPLLGGAYRSPPVLHDSNFDGGQDVWRLVEYCQARKDAGRSLTLVCFHSPLPVDCIDLEIKLPTRELVNRLLESRRGASAPAPGLNPRELIVARGFAAPALWTSLKGAEAEDGQLADDLKKLLECEPDFYLTPTLAGYYLPDED